MLGVKMRDVASPFTPSIGDLDREGYSKIFSTGTISTSSGRRPMSNAPTILSSARISAGLGELYSIVRRTGAHDLPLQIRGVVRDGHDLQAVRAQMLTNRGVDLIARELGQARP